MTFPRFASSTNSFKLGVTCVVIQCTDFNASLLVLPSSIRLSLLKGEGRVRVCGLNSRTVEPLTSILSPRSRGRGGQKRGDFIRAFTRELIDDRLRQFLVQARGSAREFFCHWG